MPWHIELKFGIRLSFSATEPKAQIHYCDHVLSFVRCSFVCQSLTFHIFHEPLNGIQRNLTGSNISTSSSKFVVFFLADRKKKMAALVSDWLRYCLLLLWNRWTASTKFDRKHDLHDIYQFCVFRVDQKKHGCPCLWFGETFLLLLWNC